MSFVYPRKITITRPATNNGIGAVDYQGLDLQAETIVVSNISASIQQAQQTRKPDANLPADTARGTIWNIFFNQPNGTVKDRDFITDDLGIRYQVLAAYWNSLGYKAECERLQT